MRLKLIYVISLIGMMSASARASVSIVEKRLPLPGGHKTLPRIFVQWRGQQVPLPFRNAYVSKLSGKDRNVWAVNFHGASNFNSVDLVVDYKGKLVIMPNIWNNIEEQAKTKKIIPSWPFDHLIFEVKKIDKMRLQCYFYGASSKKQSTYSKNFSVLLIPQNGRIKLLVS